MITAGRSEPAKEVIHYPRNPYRAAGTFAGVSYTERDADEQLRTAIERNQRYPYILAPRQSGKSSLIRHTMIVLDPSIYRCVFVDLSVFPKKSLENYDRFLDELITTCAHRLQVARETLTTGDFTAALKVILRFCKEHIVVFIDEIDVLSTVEFKDAFFSLIRSVYNERAWQHELTRIQFVLSGTVHQTQLIGDPFRSPFNVGVAIKLSDLTLEQVRRITSHLQAGGARLAPQVEDIIYHYTSGSVYLTQLILEKLWEHYIAQPQKEIARTDVDAIVDTIVAESSHNIHCTNIYSAMTGAPVIWQAFAKMSAGYPVGRTAHEALQLIGIIGDNSLFQNAIYERVFGGGGPLCVRGPEFNMREVYLTVTQGRKTHVVFWTEQGQAMYALRTGALTADELELPDGVLALDRCVVRFHDTTPPATIVTLKVDNTAKYGRGVITANITVWPEFREGAQRSLVLDGRLDALVVLCDDNARPQGGDLAIYDGQAPALRQIHLYTPIIRSIVGGVLSANVAGVRAELRVIIQPEDAEPIERFLTLFMPVELEKLPHRNWLCIDFGTSAVAAAVGAGREVKFLNLQRVAEDGDAEFKQGRNLADYDPANLEFGTAFLPSYVLCDADHRQGEARNPHAKPGYPSYRPASRRPGDASFLSLPASHHELIASPERVIYSLKSWLGMPTSDILLGDEIEMEDTADGIVKKSRRLPLSETVQSGFAALLEAYVLDREFQAGQVVVCHSNTFTPFHRERLRRIVCNAVMERLDIPLAERVHLLSESDAVAYYYCMQRREQTEPPRGVERLLVYDIGAGTLDLSVIRIEWQQGMSVYPKSWAVESRLGVPVAGNYLDEILARLIHETLAGGTLNWEHFEYAFPIVARHLQRGEEREHRSAIYALWMAIQEAKQGRPGQSDPWRGEEPFRVAISELLSGASTVVRSRILTHGDLDQYTRPPGAHETGVWYRGDLGGRLYLSIPAAQVHGYGPMEEYLDFVTSDVIDATLFAADLEAKDVDTVLVSGRGALWPGLRARIWQQFPYASRPDLSGEERGNSMKEAVVRGAIAWQELAPWVVQFQEPPAPRLGVLLENEYKLIPEEEWTSDRPISLVANTAFRLVQVADKKAQPRYDAHSLRRHFYIDVGGERFHRDTFWKDDPHLYITKRVVDGHLLISLKNSDGFGMEISTVGWSVHGTIRPPWPIGQTLLDPSG